MMDALKPFGLLDEISAVHRSGMTPEQRRRDDRSRARHVVVLMAGVVGSVVIILVPWVIGAVFIVSELFPIVP